MRKGEPIVLRLIIAGIFVVLFLLLAIPGLGIEWIVGLIDRRAADISQLRIVQWAFRVVMKIAGTRVTYIGNENLPKKGEAVLYAANHRGIFDIVAAYAHMPDLTGFISKDSVRKYPILPWIMKRLYCLFLDRKDNKKGMQTILQSFDVMKKGVSIFIFPEGTRNRHEDPTDLLMFHNGSFKAAQRVGCPVIPVAILGTDACFERQKPLLKSAHVIVHFGKPVLYEDLPEEGKKHIGDHFQAIVREMLKEDAALV